MEIVHCTKGNVHNYSENLNCERNVMALCHCTYHTHTHTHTHTCRHTHILHMHTSHIHTCKHTHTHLHTRMYTRMHAHIHTHAYTHIHMHSTQAISLITTYSTPTGDSSESIATQYAQTCAGHRTTIPCRLHTTHCSAS